MKTLNLILLGLLPAFPLNAAVTLLEVDFSGSGSVGSFNQANSQFTVLDSKISSATFSSIGGSNNTSSWVYDGTGTAATNTDLHVSSTFGGPTRFDLDLGLATAGQSYTIQSVEIDIRASNSAGTNWEFGYRDTSNATQLVGTQNINTQSGANPITTYSIDLSGENLSATDSSRTWVQGGTGNLRFLFFDPTGTGNDNFQVDAIRLIGVPEPTTVLLLSIGSLGLLRRRR